MDQLQSIRVYARVVEAGSFTKAAESLNLEKGTVTRHIQHLESRLKLKLLNRTTRRVTVTAEGAAYYERTSRLLSDLDDVEASMVNAHAKPSGRLRVDVGTSVGQHIVIPALGDFYRCYPDIWVELGVSDRAVDLITDNVDCVIRAGELCEQSLVARRIGDMSVVTVASPAYLKANGTPTHPEQLEDEHSIVNYFSTRTGRLFPNEFEKDGERLEILGRYCLSVNDSNAVAAALLSGLGVAQAGAFFAMPLVERGELVQVLEDWKVPPVPVYVVYPPNRNLSAKVRAFVEWAAELFASNPYICR
jgi:LysR family transcriptional regulator for bpeEF and oprC